MGMVYKNLKPAFIDGELKAEVVELEAFKGLKAILLALIRVCISRQSLPS